MRYRVYGLDAISKEARPPLTLEADNEESARRQAAEMGMAVHQVEALEARTERPLAPPPPAAASQANAAHVLYLLAVGFFVFVLLVLFGFVRQASDSPAGVLGNEAALTWTLRAAGTLVAAAAAFALLLRGLTGTTPGQQAGLVLPLLGGVLLVSTHWIVAVVLGTLAIALVAAEIYRLRYGSV